MAGGSLSEDHDGTGHLTCALSDPEALFPVCSQYRCDAPREVEQLHQLLLYWEKLKNAHPHLLWIAGQRDQLSVTVSAGQGVSLPIIVLALVCPQRWSKKLGEKCVESFWQASFWKE